MAKMDTLKQLEMIDALKNRVQSILEELEILRISIAESENAYNPSSSNGVALDDVFNVLAKRNHKSSRFKLRELCKSKNISTLDEFLQIPPREFIENKGIGRVTAYEVRDAIESLGVVWSDAT
ncbi:MAG: hypothetical protein IJT46_05580 [Bacteroidaceae bacterium]|nr:hypothetical protein [Bacteroidaceae bacterium]